MKNPSSSELAEKLLGESDLFWRSHPDVED